MANIEIPETVSTEGIAFLREVTELVVRYFRDENANGYVQPELAIPTSKKSADPGGDGPFGPCPRCKVGQVVRQHRRNDGGSHLQCTENKYDTATKTKSGCQWLAWNLDAQEAFFKGNGVAWPKRTNNDKPTNKPASTAGAPVSPVHALPPKPEVAAAGALVDRLNDLSVKQRNTVLEPLGYKPSGSYVQFVYSAKPKALDAIAGAIDLL